MNEGADGDDGCKKIGQLNGKWSILFRAVLVLAGFIIPYNIAMEAWQTAQIHEMKIAQAQLRAQFNIFASEGPRYTPTDALALEAKLQVDLLELREKLMTQVRNEFPLKSELNNLQRRLEAAEKKLEERN